MIQNTSIALGGEGAEHHTSNENRIAVLDGWRAISALMVIIAHLWWSTGREPFYLGRLGVEIFFAISGYIICRGFIAETERFGRISLRAFYIRRVFRILPPLVIYVIGICALISAGLLPGNPSSEIRALTFTCNWPDAECTWWISHTWSLSFEEQFYLLAPLLFMGFGVSRRIMLTALAMFLPVFVLGLYFIHWPKTAQFVSGFLTISAGVACALNEPLIRRAAARIPTTVVPIALGTLLLISLHTGTRAATALSVLLAGPLIILVLMQTLTRNSGLSAVLASYPLRSLGLVSYTVYLWQQPATTSTHDTGWGVFLTVICLIFSFLSYRYIERFLIKLGRRLSSTIRDRRSPLEVKLQHGG